MRPVIVVHYSEIALKGRNRDYFEHTLIANIRQALAPFAGVRVERRSGRIVLRWPPTADADRAAMMNRLTRVFGIANMGFGYEVRTDPEGTSADAVAAVVGWLAEYPFRTFAVRAKHASPSHAERSMDIERRIGAAIQSATGLGVDLEHPDCTVRIEFMEQTAFVLIDRREGPGGLPTGVSGSVVALLSSGFDSPVAAWQLMRRGARVTFVHFHSYPYTSGASMDNVRSIVRLLADWQGTSTLILVPLIDLQRAVLTGAPHALRVLLYRRAMVRIAEHIARTEHAHALVTGESLGQVASQTLPNIAAVDAAVHLPILRPLIGTDKLEIIREADRIGTGAIARRPYDDCCSLFTPAHPATNATADLLDGVEQQLALLDRTRELFDEGTREIIASSAVDADGHNA
jgi:thiamine biosynthesis protein ThiI